MVAPGKVEVGGGIAGRRALSRQGQQVSAGSIVEHEDALGGQGIGGDGFDDSGGESGGHQRVEGVAAGHQHSHTGHGRQVVAGGDDPLGGAHHRAVGDGQKYVTLFEVVMRLCAYHLRSSGCRC